MILRTQIAIHRKNIYKEWMKSEQISRCHPRFLCVYSQIRRWYHFPSLVPRIISSISSECPNVWVFFVYVWICYFKSVKSCTNESYQIAHDFNICSETSSMNLNFICTRVSNEKRENRKTEKTLIFMYVNCHIFELKLSVFKHAIIQSK